MAAAALVRRFRPLSLLNALLGPHGVDRYTELVHPMLTVHEARGQITSVHRQGRSVTLRVRPNAGWQGFRAGQFVRVAVRIDGVRRSRCYSPANAEPGHGELEFTVRAHDGGLVSGHLYRTAAPGMVLGLTAADGEFTLPAPRPDRLLLISGGSGITPVLSMLRTLAEEIRRGSYRGEVALLHYTPTLADFPYAELLPAGERIYTRIVQSTVDGRLSAAHLRSVAPWYADAPAYVCGPPSLHDATRELCTDVRTEEFVATGTAPDADARGEVTFADSGITVPNSGRTLLEQAEDAGLRPEHGCRMGICFSCTTIRRTGGTRDVKSGARSAEDGEEVQLCVSVPDGDVELAL